MTLPTELAESTVPIVVGTGLHKQRYVLAPASVEAIDRLKNAVSFDDADVRAWMRDKSSTLWGQFFQLTTEDDRNEASLWFMQQFQSFLAWRLTKALDEGETS